MKKLLLLLLLLTSCGSGDPFAIEANGDEYRNPNAAICPTMTLQPIDGSEVAKLSQEIAVAAWNQAIGQEFLVIQDSIDPMIDVVLVVDLDGDLTGAAYFRQECTGFIKVTKEGSESTFLWMHEIGHVLGFDHTDDQGSIMHHTADGGGITENMVALVQAELEKYNH